MIHAAVIGKRSLLLAGFALSALLAMVGVAHGEGFGELRRFGGPGTEAGELTASRLPATGPKEAVEWQPQHVIGVDPKTNDVFVLEEYEEQEEKKNKTIQFFRLQEFSSEKSGELLGSAKFKFTSDAERHAIEGIAIDPKSERLFFLISEERPEGKAPEELPDETDTAATALYAFKTTPNDKKLEPVAEATPLKEPGDESTAPVLIGPSTLKSNSQTPGEALLEPRGIAVDPASEEVLITAHVDDQPCAEEEPGAGCEEDPYEPDALSKPDDHYVAVHVKESGADEQLDVDSGNVIKKEDEDTYFAPSSPVVAADGGSGRLLTLHALEPKFGDELRGLAEFPAGDTGAPTQFPLPDTGGAESGFEEVEDEWVGGGGGPAAIGGSLAVDPEEANVLYGVTRVVNEEEAGKEEILYGISERSAETLKPIGWSGGQRASQANDDTCALQPGRNEGEHIQIAVGSHGDVFVLVPEYLREPLGGGQAGGEEKFPTADAIIEFGPGGKGCPAASVQKIAATVAGKEVNSAATGQTVTLSSFVKQGDALSTVWKLENEATKKTVTSEQLEDDQHQTPTLETSFAEAGEYKITEEIKTDNLDTPSLTVSRVFKATEKGEEAPKVKKNPENVTVNEGESATFEAMATGTPAPTVQWEVSSDGGTTFTPITGATTDTLTVPATKKSESGYRYRAVFTNSVGEAKTSAATLTVNAVGAPVVTKEPVSVTVDEGQSATFEAAAEATLTPTVQWEVSSDGGSSYSPIAGATTDTLTVPATTKSESGNLYEAVFKNADGTTPTKAAALTVDVKPKITTQPASSTVSEGGTATFHAAAEGSPAPTVQWEVSTNGGSSWAAVTGATADTLTIPAVALADNGFQYRAVFTNAAGKETSAVAVLTVTSATTTTTTTTPPTTTTPKQQVEPFKAVAPTATVASGSLVVSSTGAVSIKVSCPTGATTCIGTVTLKTLTAISASKGKKKAILTLATGSFSVSGGEVEGIILHLSKTAREVLAKDHELRARASVAAHDPAGEKATSTKLVTLRPAPNKKKH